MVTAAVSRQLLQRWHTKLDKGHGLTDCEQQSSVICKHGVSMHAPFVAHHQG